MEDDVFGRSPPRQLTGQMDSDELRVQHLPREVRHHVDRVGATDSAGKHAKATGVRRMGIGPDHHAARKRVVLEHDLMNDAGSRPPESDAIARRAAAQEVIDLAVGRLRGFHVLGRALVGLDQVVAVHRRRHCRFTAPGLHELEQCHLCGRVLHGDAIGAQQQIALSSGEFLRLGIGEVAEQHLLGIGQGTPEPLTNDLEIGGGPVVRVLDECGGGFDRHAGLLGKRAT